MPNFGIWEMAVVLTPVLIFCGIAVAFSPRVIRGALTEIRKMWRDADPSDNHKGT